MTAILPRRSTGLTLSMLSTYPPTACGLATFSSALERSLLALGYDVRMVRIADGAPGSDRAPGSDGGPKVAGVLVNGSPSSIRATAAVLTAADAVIVQHEYGIFGGPDGQEVLDVLRLVDAPVITVLHTVPVAPAANQRRILEELGRLSARIVVLTRVACDRLLSGYAFDARKVVTIPHGAIVTSRLTGNNVLPHPARPQLLSWGLLGPGKGLEHVIDAIGTLRNDGHRVRYTIAGMTHPKVVERNGEAYRTSLVERARARGVRDLVRFDQSYRSPDHLAYFLSTSSVIVLPYASTDQAVSGVLVDSIAAGRPVIATTFPHAVELLSDGAGILVEHGDQAALVAAIRAATSDQDLLDSMTDAARRLAPMHSWAAVGEQYAHLAATLARQRQSIPA